MGSQEHSSNISERPQMLLRPCTLPHWKGHLASLQHLLSCVLRCFLLLTASSRHSPLKFTSDYAVATPSGHGPLSSCLRIQQLTEQLSSSPLLLYFFVIPTSTWMDLPASSLFFSFAVPVISSLPQSPTPMAKPRSHHFREYTHSSINGERFLFQLVTPIFPGHFFSQGRWALLGPSAEQF